MLPRGLSDNFNELSLLFFRYYNGGVVILIKKKNLCLLEINVEIFTDEMISGTRVPPLSTGHHSWDLLQSSK